MREQTSPVGKGVCLQNCGAGTWIVNHVACVGERVQELAHQGPGAGANTRTGQETHGTFLLADGFQPANQVLVNLLPFNRLAFRQGLVQSLLVVQPQERGLPGCTEAAAGQRMFRVAFELDRTTIAILE